MKEWYEFKVVGKHLKIQDLLERTMSNKDRFPFLSKLLEIVAVLPASTSSCERGFSQMYVIKGKLRSSMNPSTLNDLLMIHTNGPSLQDFIPDKLVNKWYFATKKRHNGGHKKLSFKLTINVSGVCISFISFTSF
jgi:hypothetical protein